ncbi:MAG: LysE family translocator, partial [Geodermatophilaceae bacterium]|nr:LysE family translocator [Geodermatophilaceae bacterium]
MFVDAVPAAVASFALVAGLVTITPGLDTALVLRSALTKGRWPAYATALGVCSGVLVWGMAAAVGISALLTASEVAYTVLRLVGAAYLIWLGLRLLWAAIRRDRVTEASTGDVAPGTSGWAAWRQGFGVNILNPKIGAFYVALLPQFIPADAAPVLMGLLLATVHAVEGIVWFSLIIAGAHAMRAWLGRRRVQRSLDGSTGAVLIGFGIALSLP